MQVQPEGSNFQQIPGVRSFAHPLFILRQKAVAITLFAASILSLLVAIVFPPVAIPFALTAMALFIACNTLIGATDIQEALGKDKTHLSTCEKIVKLITGSLIIAGGAAFFFHPIGLILGFAGYTGRMITHVYEATKFCSLQNNCINSGIN